MDFMKKLIAILTFLCLVSCGKEVPKTEIKKEKVPETEVWVSKNQKFLDQFKTVDFDTLKVYSGEEIYNEKFEFFGKKIDSSDVNLFPEQYNAFDNGKIETYAVYKFNIDENNLGLIARTPSEYWPTSLKLFVYNKSQERIIDFIEIAESWGDAGDVLTKKSWIYKAKNNQLNCFLWRYYAHDDSMDEDNETPSFMENHYFLLQFNNGKFDTISKNNKQLEKQFSIIIKKESL